jgi:uncharacterized protein YceK
MAIRAIGLALLLSSLPSAGCGTVVNLVKPGPEQGGVIPFGGVKHDVAWINKAAGSEPGCKTAPVSDSEHYRQMALMIFCAADLPFSFIGDVVTWPYTASYTFINEPIPVPPVIQAHPIAGPAGIQAPAEVQPQPAPLETLPEPKKVP